MKRAFVLALLLALPAALPAQTIDASGLKDGTYTYKVVVAGGEITSMVPTRVIVLSPTDPSQPPPAPTDPTELEKSVKLIATDTLAKQGSTKQTGAALSAVYSALSSEIKAGSISVIRNGQNPSDAERALSLGLNLALSKSATAADKEAWGHFRTSVSVMLTQMANQGDLGNAAQWSSTLNQIHKGIDSATGVEIDVTELNATDPAQAGILEGIDLAKIIELIKLLLELFKAFKS
jgi:hypothetical protein